MVRRILGPVLLLWLVCVVAAPAAAAGAVGLRADLNADGVPDTALVRATRTAAQIELRLSGESFPVYLLAASPVQTLRSIDLTGDGLNDLLADSASGLLLWVNSGGRFVPVPITLALTAAHVPVAGSAPDDDSPPPVVTSGSIDPSLLTSIVLPAPDRSSGWRARAACPVLPRSPCAAPISRAPPVLS